MRARLGAPKAVTAVAHKLAKIVYGMLKYGKPYIDQGADYYQERYHQQLVNHLRRRAPTTRLLLSARHLSSCAGGWCSWG